MNELLSLAIKAHGGLDRWQKVRTIEAAASITGAIWYVKGRPDVLKNVVVTSETGPERVTMTFTGQDKRSIFEPDRVVIETDSGTLIEARDNPEASFDGQQLNTPWDDIHVAYFSGEALWTYLNTPFLYARSDFTTEEISSIDVVRELALLKLKLQIPPRYMTDMLLCLKVNGTWKIAQKVMTTETR